ncbi:MAG: hypothetical protein GW941_02460 [Candidatus Pacebacteria bacterium]|nr:hypothetical protein [Candidatus Paceibacterota bacterium]
MINSTQTRKNGFTLIELLITTSLTVLLLLAISSLFMTFLIGNSKTNTKKTVKEEGYYALSQMEFLIRNSQYIDETVTPCMPEMMSIAIVSKDGGSTILTALPDAADNSKIKIASNEAFLTSGAVTLDLENSRFDCSGSVGNRQVGIRFGLEKTTPDGIVSEQFNSIVSLRN